MHDFSGQFYAGAHQPYSERQLHKQLLPVLLQNYSAIEV